MRRQQILIALVLIFGLGVGFVAGRFMQGQASPTNDTPAFVQAVGQAGTSALTLELLRGGEPGKVERLHSALLRSSLEAADRLQSAPLVPDVPLPNLVEAAARTAAFCKSDPELAEMAGTAAEVRDRMQALSDGAL